MGFVKVDRGFLLSENAYRRAMDVAAVCRIDDGVEWV